jgi:hypothetical protein
MKTETEINNEKSLKPRPDLVPVRAIMAAARAFAYGANKHGLGNTGRGTYRDAGTDQAEIATHKASFLRHWLAYWSGELVDPESGLSHLDCMAAQLGIVIDLVEDPPGPKVVQEIVLPITTTVLESSPTRVVVEAMVEVADEWALPTGWGWVHDQDGWNAYHSSGNRWVQIFQGRVLGDRVDNYRASPEVEALVRRRNGL